VSPGFILLLAHGLYCQFRGLVWGVTTILGGAWAVMAVVYDTRAWHKV
jgi:hypothetical protein